MNSFLNYVKSGIFVITYINCILSALAVFPVRKRSRRNIETEKSQLWTKEYGGAVRKFVLDFRPETFRLHQHATLTQTKYLNR
jgi:hypothetical protein